MNGEKNTEPQQQTHHHVPASSVIRGKKHGHPAKRSAPR
jgi:hypothetical protein